MADYKYRLCEDAKRLRNIVTKKYSGNLEYNVAGHWGRMYDPVHDTVIIDTGKKN